MSGNDETFAFRAPKYLKYLVLGLGLKYGDLCRACIENHCGMIKDEDFPTGALIPPEKCDEAIFILKGEIQEKERLIAVLERIKQLQPVVQCTTK